MRKEGLIKYNSFTVVLLVVIYSITTIFSIFVNQGYLIIGLSLVVVGPMIVMNYTYDLRTRNILALIFDILILLVLVVQYLTHSMYQDAILTTLINFLGIGTLGLLVGASRIDMDCCIRYLKGFAYVGLVVSVVYLVMIRGNFAYSMRFGYGLLPSAMAFLLFYYKESKIYYLGLLGFCFVLLMAWGSRGALLAILLFFFVYLLRNKNWVMLLLGLLLVVLLWGLLMQIMEEVVYFVSDLTGARKIEGILNMVSGETDLMESSSGREALYRHAIQLFLQEPFGTGVGYWAYDPAMSGLYPHNIFLQVATELGIFGLLALLAILAVTIVRLVRMDRDSFLFWGMLFSITYGRLMVSSTLWERPEVWLLTGAMLFGSSYSEKQVDA